MKHKLLLFSILLLTIQVNAQDPLFNQISSVRSYFNPGITGSDSTLLAGCSWNGSIGNYNTTLLSAEKYVRILRGGLGFSGMIDDFKPFHDVYLNLTYAPHFEFFNRKLSVNTGFQGSFIQKSINWNQFYSGNNLMDNRSGNQYKETFDFNAGVFAYTKKLYAGVAAYHLTQPDVGFLTSSILPIRWNLNIGANFDMGIFNNGKFILSPNIISIRQQNFRQTSFGINAKLNRFIIGTSYINKNAIASNIGFQNKYFKIGYTYRLNISQITNITYANHELQLTGFISRHKKACKINTLRLI